MESSFKFSIQIHFEFKVELESLLALVVLDLQRSQRSWNITSLVRLAKAALTPRLHLVTIFSQRRVSKERLDLLVGGQTNNGNLRRWLLFGRRLDLFASVAAGKDGFKIRYAPRDSPLDFSFVTFQKSWIGNLVLGGLTSNSLGPLFEEIFALCGSLGLFGSRGSSGRGLALFQVRDFGFERCDLFLQVCILLFERFSLPFEIQAIQWSCLIFCLLGGGRWVRPWCSS